MDFLRRLFSSSTARSASRPQGASSSPAAAPFDAEIPPPPVPDIPEQDLAKVDSSHITPRPEGCPEFIESYDALGRAVRINREKWAAALLPRVLRDAWSNPAALYAHIVQALDYGLHREVKEAALRLKSIDTSHERGLVVAAIVLALDGDVKAGLAMVDAQLASDPLSSTCLTAKAKILLIDHQENAAADLVEKSVNLDPNQEDALYWYLDRIKATQGEDAVIAELRRLQDFSDSWRPALLLARDAASRNRKEEALALLKQALERHPAPEVLTAVGGELGRIGHTQPIIELLSPIYQLRQHGVAPGLNLVQALIIHGQRQQADELLHLLFMANDPRFRPQLMQLSAQLSDLARRDYAAAPKAPADKPGQVQFLRISRPLWHHALLAPEWLLPPKQKEAVRLAFLPLALKVNDAAQDAARSAQIRAAGVALSCSVPLLFSEMIGGRPDCSSAVFLPYVMGKGPLVQAQEWTQDHIAKAAGLDKASPPQFIVAGTLTMDVSAATATILFTVHTPDGSECARIERTGAGDDLMQTLIQAGNELVPHATGRVADGLFNTPPPPALLNAYLQGTSHLFALFMAEKDIIPPQTVFHVRDILEQLYAFTVNAGKTDIPPLYFLAALAYTRAIGDRSFMEFGQRAFALLHAAKPGSSLHQCAPFLLRLFDQQAQLREFLNSPAIAKAPKPYHAWLMQLKPG